MDKKTFASKHVGGIAPAQGSNPRRKPLAIKLYTGNNSLTARWFVEYRDAATNKRIRVYKDINRCKTVEERHQRAKEVIEQVKRSLISIKSDKVVDALHQEFMARLSIWKEKTRRCKRSKLKIFTHWMHGQEWTEETIERFFIWHLTKERELNPTTYNGYLINVRQFLGWIGLRDLAKEIKKRKQTPVPARYFSESQRKFLFAKLKDLDPQLATFVQFIYYTFLRPRQELRLLKVGDIILEDLRITVPGVNSKNKRRQYVAIPDAFVPTVAKLIRGRSPAEFLFPRKNDPFLPMGNSTMGAKHLKILRHLKFDSDEYKLYSWKHTGVVAAVRAGINLKDLQIQLRHHSLDQVDDYLRQLGVADLKKLQQNFPSL